MGNFYNSILIIISIGIGIYFIYSTYKKPAPFYSTNIKGYVAGILFLIIGVLSLSGRFSIFEVLKELFNK
jgi:hypothetical protein